MPAITTKSSKARAESAEEKSSGSASSRASSAASSSPASTTEWSVDEKGIYSGPGKHYGDTQPKVAVGSVKEAIDLIKQVDPTAKAHGDKAPVSVSSQADTVNTNIVEVNGQVIISGPLAAPVASMRGLDLLTAGQGNPSVAPAEE